MEDGLLVLDRNGYMEEVEGIFCIGTNTPVKVIDKSGSTVIAVIVSGSHLESHESAEWFRPPPAGCCGGPVRRPNS